MLTEIPLPPHVWALVLCDATVHDLFVVAHACRALHTLITSQAECTCARGLVCNENEEGSRTRAFWTHLRDARAAPFAFDEWSAYVRWGHVAHVAMALRCGVDPSANSQCAIRDASEYGHVDVVRILLRDARVDPSADDQYAIGFASRNGHVEVVERLLRDARVDPGADRQWAIRHASETGHVAVVDRLLRDSRVDPSANDHDAIRWASRQGHVKVVERLLRDPRVDPSADDQEAIRWASTRGHLETARLLLGDERVARDVEALRECIAEARERGHGDVVTLLERFIAKRNAVSSG